MARLLSGVFVVYWTFIFAFTIGVDSTACDKRHLGYYQTLGLECGATLEQIREAYKALTWVHHPDKGGTTAAYIPIRGAYDHLKKAVKKPINMQDHRNSHGDASKENASHTKTDGRPNGGGSYRAYSEFPGDSSNKTKFNNTGQPRPSRSPQSETKPNPIPLCFHLFGFVAACGIIATIQRCEDVHLALHSFLNLWCVICSMLVYKFYKDDAPIMAFVQLPYISFFLDIAGPMHELWPTPVISDMSVAFAASFALLNLVALSRPLNSRHSFLFVVLSLGSAVASLLVLRCCRVFLDAFTFWVLVVQSRLIEHAWIVLHGKRIPWSDLKRQEALGHLCRLRRLALLKFLCSLSRQLGAPDELQAIECLCTSFSSVVVQLYCHSIATWCAVQRSVQSGEFKKKTMPLTWSLDTTVFDSSVTPWLMQPFLSMLHSARSSSADVEPLVVSRAPRVRSSSARGSRRRAATPIRK